MIVLHTFAGLNESTSIELPLATPKDCNTANNTSALAPHYSTESIHMFARNGLGAAISDGILRISGLHSWDSVVIVCGADN